MRMKYYLRGLGVGIITATLILSVFVQKEETISDEEVMARAKELGMIMAEEGEIAQNEDDSGVLRAVEPRKVAGKEDADTENHMEDLEKEGAWEDAAETVMSADEQEPEETESEPETDALPHSESKEDASDTVSNGTQDSVKITISDGDSSYTVADKLEVAGLVEKASEFDRYLIDSGYEKYIRTGEFMIPRGAGDPEIAKIIAGR